MTRRRGRARALRDRLETLLAALVLLAVGALLGSFWLEWRGERFSGEAATAARELPPEPGERMRVEVLNGSGERGAAREAADRLRAAGFDVVYFGNAERFDHDATAVLSRSDGSEGAGRLARLVGVDSVVAAPDEALSLDATLILGNDWRERFANLRR